MSVSAKLLELSFLISTFYKLEIKKDFSSKRQQFPLFCLIIIQETLASSKGLHRFFGYTYRWLTTQSWSTGKDQLEDLKS